MNCPIVISQLISNRSHNVNSLSRYCTQSIENAYWFAWWNRCYILSVDCAIDRSCWAINGHKLGRRQWLIDERCAHSRRMALYRAALTIAPRFTTSDAERISWIMNCDHVLVNKWRQRAIMSFIISCVNSCSLLCLRYGVTAKHIVTSLHSSYTPYSVAPAPGPSLQISIIRRYYRPASSSTWATNTGKM